MSRVRVPDGVPKRTVFRQKRRFLHFSRGYGEIGRHRGLKIPRLRTCGFESRYPHHIVHIRTRFFPKKVRVRFFDRNFCERTIRNGKQERTKTWYHQAGNMPSALFGAFWVNRCVSEACTSLAITHQTLCQGAQPPLKFLRSVYAHKQPNDQDFLYNVFLHWKVWYTRLNKMGFVEVVTWIGQKS